MLKIYINLFIFLKKLLFYNKKTGLKYFQNFLSEAQIPTNVFNFLTDSISVTNNKSQNYQ